MGTPIKKNMGSYQSYSSLCPGTLVRWFLGPVVPWYSGPLVLWSLGPSSGPWSLSSGPWVCAFEERRVKIVKGDFEISLSHILHSIITDSLSPDVADLL